MLLLDVLCSKGPWTVQTATHTPPGKAFRHLRTHWAELTCMISTGNMNYSLQHLSDRKWELIPLTSLMGRIKAYVLMSVCQDLNLVLLRADFPRRGAGRQIVLRVARSLYRSWPSGGECVEGWQRALWRRPSPRPPPRPGPVLARPGLAQGRHLHAADECRHGAPLATHTHTHADMQRQTKTHKHTHTRICRLTN